MVTYYDKQPTINKAIIGNGSLLATLSPTARLEQVFWPHIDRPGHEGPFWLGLAASKLNRPEGEGADRIPETRPWEALEVDGRACLPFPVVSWLEDPGQWQPATCRYRGNSAVLEVNFRHLHLGLEVNFSAWVQPDQPVIVRHLAIRNCGEESLNLVAATYLAPALAGLRRDQALFYDGSLEALVAYGRGTSLACATASGHRVIGFRLGRRGLADDPQRGHWLLPPRAGWWASPSSDGRGPLGRADRPAIGPAAGCLGWELGGLAPGAVVEFTVLIAFGETVTAAGQLLQQVQRHWADSGTETHLEQTENHWKGFLESRQRLPEIAAGWDELYCRSLITLSLLADRNSGALIAAPEIDPEFRRSGGYAYCWPRDGVYIARAWELAGYPEIACRFYLFMASCQLPDGLWHQRYTSHGQPGPLWGEQYDETGTVIWGLANHLLSGTNWVAGPGLTGSRTEEADELTKLTSLWMCLERGVAGVTALLDPKTGLPPPCDDLWEERRGQHAYTLAALVGGLEAAASVALRLAHSRCRTSSFQPGLQPRKVKKEEGGTGGGNLRCPDGILPPNSEACDLEYLPAGKSYPAGGLQLLFCPERLRALADSWASAAARLREATVKAFSGRDRRIKSAQTTAAGRNMFCRSIYPSGRVDWTADVSLLGLAVPFGLVNADDPRLARTAEYLEAKLSLTDDSAAAVSQSTPLYKRYHTDRYIRGNPWVLSGFWFSLYYAARGAVAEAMGHLLETARWRTSTGLFPEQINPRDQQAAWVVPLAWSHAFFIWSLFAIFASKEVQHGEFPDALSLPPPEPALR